MRIGVLGTGTMAEALAGQWARAGHTLFIGGRTPGNAQALAERIGHGARAGSPREAAGFGEVTLLAVAYEGVSATLDAAGAGEGTLSGRTLIDCTNAIVPGRFVPRHRRRPGRGRADRRSGGGRARGEGVQPVRGLGVADDPAGLRGRPARGAAVRGRRGRAGGRTDPRTRHGLPPLDGGPLERARHLEATAAFLLGFWFAGAEPRAALPPAAAQVPYRDRRLNRPGPDSRWRFPSRSVVRGNPGEDTSKEPQGAATMKAISYRRYGGPEVLEYGEVRDPKVGPDSVLVRVGPPP